MKSTLKISASALATLLAGTAPAFADGEVNIYSYRQPELIKPLLDAFTKETGITTNVLFLDKGLVERMQAEGENSPADVILTVDIARLTEAKDGGVTHIPIDRAMEVMLQRGFPSRTEGGNALNVVTQDSSSGRTVVPR